MQYMVSACLAGINCRYDGTHNRVPGIQHLVEKGQAIPVCPEVIAGLGIPRDCCEIITKNDTKKVISKSGQDLTAKFKNAAQKCLKIAEILEIKKAILKSKSPSCGYEQIYDGTFSGNLITGKGITAEILDNNNIEIFTENDIV